MERATELVDTTLMMVSTDYKERFLAEYYQVRIRADKLRKMIQKYKDDTLEFEPKCSCGLLEAQLDVMELYAEVLENRAWIEGIPII